MAVFEGKAPAVAFGEIVGLADADAFGGRPEIVLKLVGADVDGDAEHNVALRQRFLLFQALAEVELVCLVVLVSSHSDIHNAHIITIVEVVAFDVAVQLCGDDFAAGDFEIGFGVEVLQFKFLVIVDCAVGCAALDEDGERDVEACNIEL